MILSLGVGTQSTYMALAITKEYRLEFMDKYSDAVIIFSDTGSEKPETITYFKEILEPILIRNKIEYYVVKSEKGKLHEYYKEQNKIPFRMYRICTDEFKVKPIKKLMRELFPKMNFKNPVTQLLGITVDEIQRVKVNKVKYINNVFPLVDNNLTRTDIINQYKTWNVPVPVKSGCFMCPFSRPDEIRELRRTHPALFEVALDLETNAIAHDSNPNLRKMALIRAKTLPEWIKLWDIEDNTVTFNDYFDYDMDECEGACFL